MKSMLISIIVPTLNEAGRIGKLVEYLLANDDEGLLAEVLVVDGGSTDQTREEAEKAGGVVVVSPQARRSLQMNCGAAAAKGNILYFLHADVFPPRNFLKLIFDAFEQGHKAGCFRRKMAEGKRNLRWVTSLSHFKGFMFRGGDASIYICRDLFEQIGGFDGEMVIMEDFEVLRRLRKHQRLHLIAEYVTASDRKHQANRSYWIHFANGLVMSMYLMGFSQNSMVQTYRRLVSGTRFRM